MSIWVDPPRWPAHGAVWSHVISDRSVHELHEFAGRAGLSPRGFDADHYDVPSERVRALIALGARPTSSRELLRRLTTSGLRVPKGKRERLLATEPIRLPQGEGRRELIGSPATVRAAVTYLLAASDAGLLVTADGGIPYPEATAMARATPLGYERLRPLGAGRGRPARSWVGMTEFAADHGVWWLPLARARQRWGEQSWWQLVGPLFD